MTFRGSHTRGTQTKAAQGLRTSESQPPLSGPQSLTPVQAETKHPIDLSRAANSAVSLLPFGVPGHWKVPWGFGVEEFLQIHEKWQIEAQLAGLVAEATATHAQLEGGPGGPRARRAWWDRLPGPPLKKPDSGFAAETTLPGAPSPSLI